MRSSLRAGFGALLYGLAALGANAAGAGLSGDDLAVLDALREGEMEKLVLHETPAPPIDVPFADVEGNEVRLSDFAGKVVLLNLWATWCPPCRSEMPSLDRLAGAMAGPDFAVVALSTDRGGPARIRKFFDDTGVEHLGVYQDARMQLAREAGAIGLPVTLLLDRQGREVGRVTGDAKWDSPEAKALLQRFIDLTGAPATEKAESAPGAGATTADAS